MTILLKPFIKLAGWLVMRDLKKWTKTPLLLDTAVRLEMLHIYYGKLIAGLEAEQELLSRMLIITKGGQVIDFPVPILPTPIP